MNIYVELNQIIEYIENHLEEPIDYKELAKIMGVNEYTFQKIFSVICNISVTEYIRNRRLSNAGQDLFVKNEKIIDIAIKYQYNNPTAFSRAFQRFYGIKPSEVRRKPEKLKLYAKLHFEEKTEQSNSLDYKIIETDQMILYGKYKMTNNENIRVDAPKFYQEMKRKFGIPMYGMVEYKDKERESVKAYWALYNLPSKGLEKKMIPKSKWICIRVKSQEAKDIQKISNDFYNSFFYSFKYNFRDLPEIEYYHDEVTDFMIPIED